MHGRKTHGGQSEMVEGHTERALIYQTDESVLKREIQESLEASVQEMGDALAVLRKISWAGESERSRESLMSGGDCSYLSER